MTRNLTREKANEQFLNDVRDLKLNLRSIKTSVRYIEELLLEIGVPTASFDEKVQNNIRGTAFAEQYEKLVLRRDEALAKLYKRTDVYLQVVERVTDAILNINVSALHVNYAVVPSILTDKYLGLLSDDELMKKYHVSWSTLRRMLKAGFELFEIPKDLDKTMFNGFIDD